MNQSNKEKLKTALKNIVRWTAILMLKKYKPKVIAITGSVGKTSAKEAIYTVLKKHFSVRRSRGNFNNELGLPLNILGDYSKIQGGSFWLEVLLLAIFKLIFVPKKLAKYPEILILEMAADKSGDIEYLVKIAQPTIGVITAIGDIPVHVENYSGPEAVAREKGKLVKFLPEDGLAVLNGDDILVSNMREKTDARVATFGFGKGVDVQIDNFEYRFDENIIPQGISLKIHMGGGFTPMRLNGALGRPQAYAVGIAVIVGLEFDLNLVEISEALLEYEPVAGRMKMIKGFKKSLILDDSYNASPIAVRSALQTLADLPATRRIAVLGDMRELGKYSKEAHLSIGKIASKIVDLLFCVGEEAKFIAESTKKSGLAKDKIFIFENSDEAKKPIKDILQEGDLVLVKGSHSVALDLVVDHIKLKR